MPGYGYGNSYGFRWGGGLPIAASEVVLGNLVSSATAIHLSNGVSSVVLGQLSGTATAQALGQAYSNVELNAVTLESDFFAATGMDQDVALDAVLAESSAYTIRIADASITFGDLEQLAEAYTLRIAAGAATFPAITNEGQAAVVATARSDHTIPNFETVAVARAPAGLVSEVVFNPIEVEGASRAPAGANVDATYPDIVAEAATVVLLKAVSSVTLAGLTQVAEVVAPATALSSVTLDRVGLTAAAVVPGVAQSAVTLAGIGVVARAVAPAEANSEVTLRPLTASASAILIGVPVSIVLPGDVLPIHVPPNWASPFVVEREFKTDVFKTRSGIEQRRGLRLTPRKKVRYNASLKGAERSAIVAQLGGWHDRRFVLADYATGIRPTAPLAPNEAVLVLGIGRVPTWVQVGSLVALVERDYIEHRFVAKVEADRIHFSSTTGTEFSIRSTFCAAYMGRFESGMRTKRYTSRVEDLAVDFTVDPTSEIFFNPGSPARTYRGVEMLVRRPNWKDGAEGEYMANIDRADFGIGPVDYYPLSQFRQFQFKFEHLLKNEYEVEDLFKFFLRQRGRRGSFFAPTWQKDYEIGEPFAAGATSFFAYSVNHGLFLDADPAYKDIVVIAKNRNLYPLRIKARGAGGDFTRIELEKPIPIASKDIATISWLPRCRLATDALTLNYRANNVAEVDLQLLTLESDQ